MKKLFGLFLLALTFLAPGLAQAATCFWVGGTGSWSTSNQASWSSGTGGAGSTCAATGGIPKQATDIATFDASSGGGTVTVDSTMNGVTMATILAGAFTGTLDFSVNNPSMTLTTALSLTGTGTRKFLLGTGTFTLTAASGNVYDLTTVTNLDGASNFAANFTFTSTTANARNFVGNAKTYGTFTISANSSRGVVVISGANTFAAISIGDGNNIQLPVGVTTTVTGAVTGSGSSATSTIALSSASIAAGISTLSSSVGATLSFAIVYGITTGGGGSFVATNSFDQGRNTTFTITGPSGGGGRIIGG
jgi:hypothetical protein